MKLLFNCSDNSVIIIKTYNSTIHFNTFLVDTEKLVDENSHILKAILNMKEMKLSFHDMAAITLRFKGLMTVLMKNEIFKNYIEKFENGENRFFKMFCKSFSIVVPSTYSSRFEYSIDWFHGLLNHSCKPNVIAIHDPFKRKMYYVLIENVQAGEELTISYW